MDRNEAEGRIAQILTNVAEDMDMRKRGHVRIDKVVEVDGVPGQRTSFFTGDALRQVALEVKRVLGLKENVLFGSARDIPFPELVHRIWVFNQHILEQV